MCILCGKTVFRSRKLAKQYAKASFPNAHVSAYPCPHGRGWVWGNLPDSVIEGEKSRDEL